MTAASEGIDISDLIVRINFVPRRDDVTADRAEFGQGFVVMELDAAVHRHCVHDAGTNETPVISEAIHSEGGGGSIDGSAKVAVAGNGDAGIGRQAVILEVERAAWIDYTVAGNRY